MSNSKITIQDVYNIVDRMETNVDRRLRDIQTAITDNTVRITALEIWRANLMGKIAVVGGVIILGFNLVIEYIKEKVFKQ